jgi:hypothetical protein
MLGLLGLVAVIRVGYIRLRCSYIHTQNKHTGRKNTPPYTPHQHTRGCVTHKADAHTPPSTYKHALTSPHILSLALSRSLSRPLSFFFRAHTQLSPKRLPRIRETASEFAPSPSLGSEPVLRAVCVCVCVRAAHTSATFTHARTQTHIYNMHTHREAFVQGSHPAPGRG